MPNPRPASGAGSNDEPVAIPNLIQALLKVLGGLAGSTALFGALATFAGRQYEAAYYEQLGIPSSILSFSTQDYLFATRATLGIGLFGVIGAGVGITFGLAFSFADALAAPGKLWRYMFAPALRVKDRLRRIRELRSTASATERKELLADVIKAYLRFYGLILGVLAALVASFYAVVLIKDHWYSQRSWLPFAMVAAVAVASIIFGYAMANLVRKQPGEAKAMRALLSEPTPRNAKARQRAVRWRRINSVLPTALAIFGILAIVGILMIGPSKFGRSDGTHDANDPNQFIGIDVLLDARGTDAASSQGVSFCHAFKLTIQEGYCRLSNMVLIIHNDGRYFVSPRPGGGPPTPTPGPGQPSASPTRRLTYTVPDERVIGVRFAVSCETPGECR